MKIAFVDIQNFRKLKNCRIEFSEKETIFVGANNSGKTSAMDALMLFLKEPKRISTTDFTLSNWLAMEKIASGWVEPTNPENLDLTRSSWQPYLPSLDIWIQVNNKEVHCISHLIPTLDWTGGKLGVRLSIEPKDIEELYKTYKQAFEVVKNHQNERASKLWPQTIKEFLEKDNNLSKYFKIKAYTLDPSKLEEECPQTLPENSEPIEGESLKEMFRVDVINAQRGFADSTSEEDGGNRKKLSSQLKDYYKNHLDPTELPDDNDLDALRMMDSARTTFDEKLMMAFKSSLKELEGLNYPGFGNPQIHISSKLEPLDGLDHDAAIQFQVFPDDSKSREIPSLKLSEQHNGLGYQNLISMVFNLIRFRDRWMRVGKIVNINDSISEAIEPIHLVLIEEPEAHLHPQAQQVFIKKSYDILRKHSNLGKNNEFSTQLIVSTHSGHIAHEVDFGSIRYFKKILPLESKSVQCAKVINLSNTFEPEEVAMLNWKPPLEAEKFPPEKADSQGGPPSGGNFSKNKCYDFCKDGKIFIAR